MYIKKNIAMSDKRCRVIQKVAQVLDEHENRHTMSDERVSLLCHTKHTHTHFQQANSSLCVCTSCHSHAVSNPPTSTCVRRGFQLSHNFSCPLPFWQCVCVRWQYSTRVELRITSEIKQNQNLPVLVCKLCSALLLLFSPVGNVRPRCSDWFILHL